MSVFLQNSFIGLVKIIIFTRLFVQIVGLFAETALPSHKPLERLLANRSSDRTLCLIWRHFDIEWNRHKTSVWIYCASFMLVSIDWIVYRPFSFKTSTLGRICATQKIITDNALIKSCCT